MRNLTNQQIREQQLKDYLAERALRCPKLTPSITFCNSSPCRPTLTGNRMSSARAEADQNLQFLSEPMGAQIVPQTNTNRSSAAV